MMKQETKFGIVSDCKRRNRLKGKKDTIEELSLSIDLIDEELKKALDMRAE